MNLHVLRVVLMILVMWRVLRMLEDEVTEAGAVHLVVHFTGDLKNGVAQCFGLELPAVHSPKVAVLAIDGFVCDDGFGCLPISCAVEDKAVQLFN